MDFMASLLIVLLVAWAAGVISNRLGYPSMLGELVAGIVLGPPLLGILPVDDGLFRLAEIGIFVMMFYIGMEIDPDDMRKSSKPAILASIGGFLVPFAAGFAVTYYSLDPGLAEEGGALVGGQRAIVTASLFVGMAIAVTSLATKSRILLDLGLLDTRIAMVLMVGALLSDTAALVIFAGVMGFSETSAIDVQALMVVVLKVVLFFVAAVFAGIKLFPAIDRAANRLPLIRQHTNFMLVLSLALIFGEMAHLAGLHNIIGAFVAGMFIRRCIVDRQQYVALTKTVQQLSVGFLAPIFFITAGFEFSFNVFSHELNFLIVVVLAAIVGKIVGTMLFYLPSGYSWREGLTIGCGMNGRGAVEIIIAEIGYHKGFITAEIFSVLVFTAIFTTAIVPFSLKLCVDWLRRHDDLAFIVKREGFLVFGAGPLSRILAKLLAATSSVKLVDGNRENCEAAIKDGLEAHVGNALDADLLESLGADHVRATIATTQNPEINLAATKLAKDNFMIPDSYVLLGEERFDDYSQRLESAGFALLYGQPVELADFDVLLRHDRVHVAEFTIDSVDDPRLQTIRNSTRQRLLLATHHEGMTEPYAHADQIQPGDRIFVVEIDTSELTATESFTDLVRRCVILDLTDPLDLKQFFQLIAEQLTAELGLSKDQLTEDFMNRERESGTVIGSGIAVPHIRVDGNGIFFMIVARSRDGIPFHQTMPRAQIIFVLVSSSDQANRHLRTLAAIAQIVQSPNFESNWENATDSNELRSLILSAKRRRI